MTGQHTPANEHPPRSDTGSRSAGIVRAEQGDIDTLSRVIADAFHDLPPSRWLNPDPAARRQVFPQYFSLFVEQALAVGIVHTTPDRAAAALWLPADGSQALEPPAGYHERLCAVTGSWADRFLAFDAALGERHPTGFAHHYLAMIAVQPERQDQGIGTALLTAQHAMLDSNSLPAYLEAADLRTRGVYLRRGYADHGRRPIRLPGHSLMYPMVREPRDTRQ